MSTPGPGNLLLARTGTVHRQQARQLRSGDEDQRVMAHWPRRYCRNVHQGAGHCLRRRRNDDRVRCGALPATQERDDRSDANGERVVSHPHDALRHRGQV